MSIKYDSKREPLAEIIKKATINATYVIPDLQRPYVWSPSKVTMLIDSLFRGWPFGSLLLWEVKPDCFQYNEGIPHRPFWQVIDRTGNDKGTTNSALGQPATYQMVLDGQQRVQSLILALGGDQWGFQLYDSDWALDLQDRRVRPSGHWSKASLCIDLQKFKAEFGAKNETVRKIETSKILEWVIRDGGSGRSTEKRPSGYVDPLPIATDGPARFIRLSRFWDLVQKDLSEREYKKLLEPVLSEHGVTDDLFNLLDPLAEFMKLVESVKTNSFVHALQIESFLLTPQWSKDDYSDAIVNIFTRLNSLGRELTREEITLAWLKVGWLREKTDGKTAGECLDEMKTSLIDRGFKLETDEIVRLISFIWSVEHRNGNLLDSKDLLKGEIIRRMAESVASAWKLLKIRLEGGAELIEKKKLVENQGSFNAIIVWLAWYRLVFDRLESLSTGLLLVERDSLEKTLDQQAARFLDRWVFGSQWAGVWGDDAVKSFQNFATDLSTFYVKVQECNSVTMIATVEAGTAQLMGRVAGNAVQRIDTIQERDRRRVHIYYPFLWVWHRLEEARWEQSEVQLRTGRKRAKKPEVDHCVADKLWERLVDHEIQAKQADFSGADEEQALLAPDGFESQVDARAFVNLLGNCSLLEKSFNISKSDAPMWNFMEEVHEFQNDTTKRAKWEAALSLSETLTSPDKTTLIEIKKAIEIRDALIRKDLVEFIAGTKPRVD